MSLSLPLKYRPQIFKDLIGQDVPATYLSKVIRQDEPRNVILSGSHGGGKTSAGRIYARALNCTQVTAAGDPCNHCENCEAFLAERFIDYFETDLSSQGGKEDILKLVEWCRTPPTVGRYRVVLADEAHNASKAAWDALLKIVEEPPPWLIFIFCTTEGDKIRPAIRSRCQSLRITTLDKMTLTNHLIGIVQAEGMVIDPLGIELIASLAKGHARDSLTMLEQVWTLEASTLEEVTRALGLDHALKVVTVAQALLAGKTEDALNTLRQWPESDRFKRGLLADYLVFLALSATGHAAPPPHPALQIVEPARHRAVSDLADNLAKAKQKTGPILLQTIAAAIAAQPIVSDSSTCLSAHMVIAEYHVATVNTTGDNPLQPQRTEHRTRRTNLTIGPDGKPLPQFARQQTIDPTTLAGFTSAASSAHGPIPGVPTDIPPTASLHTPNHIIRDHIREDGQQRQQHIPNHNIRQTQTDQIPTRYPETTPYPPQTTGQPPLNITADSTNDGKENGTGFDGVRPHSSNTDPRLLHPDNLSMPPRTTDSPSLPPLPPIVFKTPEPVRTEDHESSI